MEMHMVIVNGGTMNRGLAVALAVKYMCQLYLWLISNYLVCLIGPKYAPGFAGSKVNIIVTHSAVLVCKYVTFFLQKSETLF